MRSFTTRLLPCAAIAVLAGAAFAQRSTWIDMVAPDTVRVNQTFSVGAYLRDAYSNVPYPGRRLEIALGDEWALFGVTPFNTNNSGWASRTWKFSQPGLYRVTIGFRGGGSLVDSRRTALIRVIR